MNKSLCRRVHRLESRIPPVPPPREPTAQEIRFQQTFGALLEKMDPEHADHVRIDIAERGGKSNLTFAAGCVTLQHLRDGNPLELPACAATIYLSDPTASPTAQCGECGFLGPFTWGKNDQPIVCYLKACPLCGGEISRWSSFAYNQSRRAELAKSQRSAPMETEDGV